MAAATSAQRSRASRLRRRDKLTREDRAWLRRYEMGLRGRLLDVPATRVRETDPVQARPATAKERHRAATLRTKLEREGSLSREERVELERYYAERVAFQRARDVEREREREGRRLRFSTLGQWAKAINDAVVEWLLGFFGESDVIHSSKKAGVAQDLYPDAFPVVDSTGELLPAIAHAKPPGLIGVTARLGEPDERRARSDQAGFWVTVQQMTDRIEPIFDHVFELVRQWEEQYGLQGVSGVNTRVIKNGD